MAYNEKLADRLRDKLMAVKKLEEKKMMGGLCFLYKTKMCCGIVKDDLMVRVIEKNYENVLSHPHARPMDFTGRPLKGFIFVAPDGFKKEKDLSFWLTMGIEYVDTLPPEKFKKKPVKKTEKSSSSARAKKRAINVKSKK